ncbi:MAG: hypothetical protein HQK51_13315 [Oligoflexia bacterium]|nr:hypothetical protein [Oligoflexia bacterium]
MEKITNEILRKQILSMAKSVEKMLKESILDDSLYEDIVNIEQKINKFHILIDQLCFDFVNSKERSTEDVRLAMSVMKINGDLERIGDLALNIKRARMKIGKDCQNMILNTSLLLQMSNETISMLKNSIDAFVMGDINLANEVIKRDQVINELNKHITYTYSQYEDLNFDQAYNIIHMSARLERIADHSTNIAEDVIFFESGKDVRHQKQYEYTKEELC